MTPRHEACPNVQYRPASAGASRATLFELGTARSSHRWRLGQEPRQVSRARWRHGSLDKVAIFWRPHGRVPAGLVVLQDLAWSTARPTPGELKLQTSRQPYTIMKDGEERHHINLNTKLLQGEKSTS